MRFTKPLFILLTLVTGPVWVTGPAWAHGPTRQKVTEEITIHATPAQVWEKIGDFNGMPAWHPAVASSVATDGNNVGSERTLTLKAGGQLLEDLEDYSAADMTLKYRIKSGVLPVSNYTSTLKVVPGESPGTSLVTWRGAFYRGFPGNDPPPEQNDDAAVAAVTGVYKTGLANLKKILEP